MRIKTITADTMADALKVIRSQLGPEALILNTRKVKGSNGQPTLEITAAVDEPEPPSNQPSSLAGILAAADKAAARPASKTLPKTTTPESPSDIPLLIQSLTAHGVPQAFISRVMDAMGGLTKSGFSATDALEMLLSKLLHFKPVPDIVSKGHAHLLVGPSGAGKTTLTAKLAIHAKRQNLKVGLMSLDDQKIAGFEPLRIAADALGETAHLIHTPADLKTAAQKLGPRHIILIDTPGLNPYRRADVNAFAARVSQLGIPHTAHLVLPAALNAHEMETVPHAFAPFSPQSLMIARLDETSHLGGLVAAAYNHPLPLGVAGNSADFATAPVALTAHYLATALATPPTQPWEIADV